MTGVISLKAARAAGLTRYFTGAACPKGHIAERSVVNSSCVICRNEASKTSRRKNPEAYRAASKVYYAQNRDELCEKSRRWRIENPDKYRATKEKCYQEHRDRRLAQMAAYQRSNRGAANERNRAYELRHRESVLARKRAYWTRNRETRLLFKKAYYRRNTAKYRAWWSSYRARKMRAMPAWASKDAISNLYEMARGLTLKTGIPHEVDHIIPLRGKYVCGLHVETNLRVVPWFVNRRKHNNLDESLLC